MRTFPIRTIHILYFLIVSLGLLGVDKVPVALGQEKTATSNTAEVKRLGPGEVRRDMPITKVRGQLVAFDLDKRTGTLIRDADGKRMDFQVLPFAILLQHAAFADLSDYREGQRLRFMLCEDSAGQLTQLVLVTDELHEIVAHNEYYFVQTIDRATGLISCRRMPANQSKVVWDQLQLQTTPETRYWREGKSNASFDDLKPGMPIRAKTYGGQGILERFVCDVLLDDDSMTAWKATQTALHDQRMLDAGIPAFVDRVEGNEIQVTTFPEATEYIRFRKGLPRKSKVLLAKAAVDRRAKGDWSNGVATSITLKIVNGQYIGLATIVLDQPNQDLKPHDLIRIRLASN